MAVIVDSIHNEGVRRFEDTVLQISAKNKLDGHIHEYRGRGIGVSRRGELLYLYTFSVLKDFLKPL